MASLAFQGLQKQYGQTRVLERVDLAVNDGEYLVLVGPSGCGKSTLLRCIAGLETISAGDLLIDGKRVNDLAPRERDVAMVFQSYALYPHMTVAENMAFPLRIAGKSKAEQDAAVAEAANLLELGPLLHRRPAELSGGQRQRVAMGRAIVRRPAIFLFDEPLSNLDAGLRSHMRVELKRLHRRLGATIVHVTHDQVEALTLADRILVLNKGVVQQAGSPAELFARPANAFVAQFIGSPSMNLIDAEGAGGAARVAGVAGALLAEGLPEGKFQLGIRPTDAKLSLSGAGLAVTVDVVERLGAEALVHVNVGGGRAVVQMPEPCSYAAGQDLVLSAGVVHAFDCETGLRR